MHYVSYKYIFVYTYMYTSMHIHICINIYAHTQINRSGVDGGAVGYV